MSEKWEFNQDQFDCIKQLFDGWCDNLCQYLAARRTLGESDPLYSATDDAVFAAASYLAQLLDGRPIEEAKEILAKAAKQVEAAHKVDARCLYSLMKER